MSQNKHKQKISGVTHFVASPLTLQNSRHVWPICGQQRRTILYCKACCVHFAGLTVCVLITGLTASVVTTLYRTNFAYSLQDRLNGEVSCAGLFIASHIGFDYPGVWMHIDMAYPVYSVSSHGFLSRLAGVSGINLGLKHCYAQKEALYHALIQSDR